jgi:hypothetical protein
VPLPVLSYLELAGEKEGVSMQLNELVKLKGEADALRSGDQYAYRAARKRFLDAQAAWWEEVAGGGPLSYIVACEEMAAKLRAARVERDDGLVVKAKRGRRKRADVCAESSVTEHPAHTADETDTTDTGTDTSDKEEAHEATVSEG